MKNNCRHLLLVSILFAFTIGLHPTQALSLPEEPDTALSSVPEPSDNEDAAIILPTRENTYIAPTAEQLELTSHQVESFDCGLVTDVPLEECQALSEFYASTNGSGWTNHTNWLETTTVANWYGVTVASGRVTKLILGSNLLTGTLPAEINLLANLKTFDVHNNQISGQFPAVLTSMTSILELELYGNLFSGTIPAQLGNLVQLTSLSLSFNQFTGTIPAELGNLTNLTKLWLYNNQLSGSIPPELGNLTKLTNLALGDNPLTGSIPPELANLTLAWAIDIKNCQLSGSIPTSFGGLTSLMYLHLDHNQLSGSIPSQLGNITNLTYLELQNNQLSGSIPTSLGNLSQLTRLYLDSNQLTGSIPTQLGTMAKLSSLKLNSNQFTGSIPSQLGQGKLFLIYLGDNQLTGSIPATLGNLSTTLRYLSLTNNGLTGTIPSQIGSLALLNYLDLSGNQLSGAIPSQIGSLVNLNHLDLSGNQFSGDVPVSIANLDELCTPDVLSWPCNGVYTTDLGYNRLNVPAAEPAASFLALKDPDWYKTQWQRVYIPSGTGGSVLSYDGTTLITIPAGAAGKDFYLEYTPLPSPSHPTGELVFADISFDLSAFDTYNNLLTVFVLPITVRISYAEANLGVSEEGMLNLYYWDLSSLDWQDAVSTCSGGTYTRNPDENWLSLPLCHLSEFSLMSSGVQTQYLPLILR